ncbi:unnamed protein product, partial [Acanthoscelides obtectus]
YII